MQRFNLNDYLKQQAQTLKVEPALLQAITNIESKGSGFVDVNMPRVLFERHLFYRRLKAQGLNADNLAVKYPSLINPKAGGYVGGIHENRRLNQAKKINCTAAIEATSYGLFQILGLHWRALGFGSAASFEEFVSKSEANQAATFISFLKSNQKLIKALQDQDFSRVAYFYNGANYEKNKYDQKLKAAYLAAAKRLQHV